MNKILEIHLAYGLPASGKTTYLKRLKGKYYNFDSPEKRFKVEEFINTLEDGNIILDFFIFNPNTLINYLFNRFPEVKVFLYVFPLDRELCLKRDKNRRLKSSENLIRNMQLIKIIPRRNLEVKNVRYKPKR